jgi:hypothetical protein
MMRWGLGALGLFVAAGVVGFGLVSFAGGASAQEPPAVDEARGKYQDLLAQKLGVTVDELEAAQKAVRDQMIDDAVAAGRLTPEQAAELKAKEPGVFPGGFRGMRGVHDSAKHMVINLLEAAAKVIGIDKAALQEGLQNGESLTDIAIANDVDSDQLTSGLAAEMRAKVAAALADGSITQEMADKLLTNLEERIAEMIEHAGPRGGRDGMPGMGPRGPRDGATVPGGAGGAFFQRGPFRQ